MSTVNIANLGTSQAIGGSDWSLSRSAANVIICANKLIDFPLGTAASPTLRPVGETNSGIYWTTAEDMSVSVNGDEVFRFGSAGIATSLGGFAGGSPAAPSFALSPGAATIAVLSADVGVSAGATLEFIEMAAPAAPAANRARLYSRDNGAGKTQLMVIFPSGAAQQLAIEP
jgi:hypothetical protein